MNFEIIQAQLIIFGKLLTASVFGGVLGYYRRRKRVGIRTLALLSLGAALFTIASKEGFIGADPSRIAAGIVTGIGFIGAGVIWKQKKFIGGITTAATVWVAASIGIATALGMWKTAIFTVIITIFLLESDYMYKLDHKK